MFEVSLILHSIVRWLVLLMLMLSIATSYFGLRRNSAFTATSNALRHWTATVTHIQLILGVILYSQSPITKYFWTNFSKGIGNVDMLFFGAIHMLLMLISIVVITIGSAKAKRQDTDHDKFKTMMQWFFIGLIIIIVAIPWPFSPLASRPYLRFF